MIIDKIKKLSKGKYKITFDNKEELCLFEDVILKHGLLYKKNIDKNLMNNILESNLYYEVFNTALKHISFRMRSKKELTEYLTKKYIEEDIVKKVIEELLSKNIINDKKFCESYINDKLYLSNYGLNKIKQNLYDFDIDSNIIESSISKIDNNIIKEKLDKLINKYINSNKNRSEYDLKNKILNNFINLGYDSDMIFDIYNSIDIKIDDTLIIKEYNKLLKKYGTKYDGYELDSYIRSRLYQKGFSSEEIGKIKRIK